MTPSVADIACTLMTFLHLRYLRMGLPEADEAFLVFDTDIPDPVAKAAAIEFINNEITDEQIACAKWLISFRLEQLPAEQRLKTRKRFFEHRKKADTPLHALQKAIEQVTAKSIAVFATENQFS